MAQSYERQYIPDPVTAYESAFTIRRAQLEHLGFGLRRGMEVVTSPSRVNEILSESPRPDLILREPVRMQQVPSIEDVGGLNNFIPRFMAFGRPRFREEPAPWDPTEVYQRHVGYQNLTEAERQQAFLLGARGDYGDTLAFAQENGIDTTFAAVLYENSHIKNESFTRMRLVVPELTDELLTACLDTDHKKDYKRVEEELFVGYAIMSRLVDISDQGVFTPEGQIDDRVLCH